MKQFAESTSDFFTAIIAGAGAAVVTAIGWIVRRIFTNQKQIEMLQVHLKERDVRHERDRQEFREDLREVKDDVKTLLRGNE